MKWFGKRCRHREDTSLLAAGALDEKEKIEAQRHLAACDECRAYYAEIESLTAPLVEWEKEFSAIETTPAARSSWARAVQDSGATPRLRQPLLRNAWRIVWHELIWPSRYAWSAIVALWIAMLAINVQLSGHPAGATGSRASSSQDIMEAWREQTRVLAGMIQPAEPTLAIPAPPPYIPRPRSEREEDYAII